MAIPVNTLSDEINNLTSKVTLSVDQTFLFTSNLVSLIIVNTSATDSVDFLIKGTRASTNLPQYGDVNISTGDNFTLTPLAVCTLAVQLMYKHFGENGDTITISSTSAEKASVICWLSE